MSNTYVIPTPIFLNTTPAYHNYLPFRAALALATGGGRVRLKAVTFQVWQKVGNRCVVIIVIFIAGILDILVVATRVPLGKVRGT